MTDWKRHCAPDCDERATCPHVGSLVHSQCGYCTEHDRPRHHCIGHAPEESDR